MKKRRVNKPISIFQKALGKCPVCKKEFDWFNDVPLRGFCWGTDRKPHNEVAKLIPVPFNPYLRPYKPTK